jgi:hypothetical protein
VICGARAPPRKQGRAADKIGENGPVEIGAAVFRVRLQTETEPVHQTLKSFDYPVGRAGSDAEITGSDQGMPVQAVTSGLAADAPLTHPQAIEPGKGSMACVWCRNRRLFSFNSPSALLLHQRAF